MRVEKRSFPKAFSGRTHCTTITNITLTWTSNWPHNSSSDIAGHTPHNRETVNTHSLTYLHIHHRNIRTFWNTKKTPTFFLLLILLLLKYLLKLFSSSSSSSSVSSFWSSSFCCCCHKYLLLPSPYHSLVFCLTTSTPLLLLFFYFIFSCSRSPSSLSTVFGSYFGPQHSTKTDNQAKTKRTHILTSHIYWLVTHTPQPTPESTAAVLPCRLIFEIVAVLDHQTHNAHTHTLTNYYQCPPHTDTVIFERIIGSASRWLAIALPLQYHRCNSLNTHTHMYFHEHIWIAQLWQLLSNKKVKNIYLTCVRWNNRISQMCRKSDCPMANHQW